MRDTKNSLQTFDTQMENFESDPPETFVKQTENCFITHLIERNKNHSMQTNYKNREIVIFEIFFIQERFFLFRMYK